eukprot:TRINITY_DN12865_c0_g1_i1.p1 TRINITY_DN12865_c0_g1~~TRINITY_DN12865_c0_g1_i1.p1  ORF type:complete len:103 (+),score=26.43 TRINITY_DN12865_c0_g1_i1:20-328(+)
MLLPGISQLVKEPQSITWTGLWAAQEKKKNIRYRSISNNVRGVMFDEMAKKVVTKWGANFLDLHAMTMSRSDLSVDSTHYSCPVSLSSAMLWLNCVCQDTSK